MLFISTLQKAGVLGRFVCFLLLKKKKLFYTPHGYSFLRNRHLNWNKKIYWMIEKQLSKTIWRRNNWCGDTEYEIAKTIGKSFWAETESILNMSNNKITNHKNEVLTLGIVGRINFCKKIRNFSMPLLLKFPDFNFFGLGWRIKPEITAQISELPDGSWKEIMALQNSCYWHIHSNIALEGLPIAVLEAMAMKKLFWQKYNRNKDVVMIMKQGFFLMKRWTDHYFKFKGRKDTKNIGEKSIRTML